MQLIVLIFFCLVTVGSANQCGISGQATGKYRPILSNYTNEENTNRILGGDESFEGRWPWITYLLSGDGNKNFTAACTATIIGDRWILTAAHCIKKEVAVRYGSIEKPNRFQNNMQLVNESFAHPCYDPSKAYVADIALLKLNEKIKFNETISPICLWKNDELKQDDLLIAAGWGVIFNYATGNQTGNETSIEQFPINYTSPKILNERLMSMKNDENCSEMIKSKDETANFKRFLCHYGVNSGGMSGDSGGPSMALKNDTWIQVGVASWGLFLIRGNNRIDMAEMMIHTRVSNYCGWIAKTTNNEVQCQGGKENVDTDEIICQKEKPSKPSSAEGKTLKSLILSIILLKILSF
uniref:Peptidase S1 domain-containing protein n=1 Tax=Panagrolaimus sp. JU765 TaxID=591449 RepID=A0AC34RH55_9BILA